MSCFLLFFSKLFLFLLEYFRLYMQKLNKTRQQQTKQKQQTTFETNNNKHQKYSSSRRNLRDIYSRSGGGLEDVLYFCFLLCFFLEVFFSFFKHFFVFYFCFCLVFLSFCMYKRKYSSKNKNTKLWETYTNTAHPAGTWNIFLRGRVVGWMSSIFFLFFAFLEVSFFSYFCL